MSTYSMSVTPPVKLLKVKYNTKDSSVFKLDVPFDFT